MNQRKKAAALKYEFNSDAPTVAASGMGYIADKIIEKAEENEVPIVYNKERIILYWDGMGNFKG